MRKDSSQNQGWSQSKKQRKKSSALLACGISDVLDTRDPVYLRVPYREKEQAKELGAKWDPKRQAWYVPPGSNVDDFAKSGVKTIHYIYLPDKVKIFTLIRFNQLA
jgi:hypothetical protein